MFTEAKNFVKRKVKKIDYKNVSLPDGYENTQTEYKKLRDSMDMVGAVIKSLSTYEHGGQLMKGFSSFSNVMASKSKIKALRREDMYTDASLVGEALSSAASNEAFKKSGRRFADAYTKLSESKLKMNEKLGDVQNLLSSLKKTAKAVDQQRNHAADLRYDLEEKIQAGGTSESTLSSLQAELNMVSKDAMAKMNDFIGQDGLAGILEKVMAAHREFAVDAAQCLGKSK